MMNERTRGQVRNVARRMGAGAPMVVLIEVEADRMFGDREARRGPHLEETLGFVMLCVEMANLHRAALPPAGREEVSTRTLAQITRAQRMRREEASRLAGNGLTHLQIAAAIGCSISSVRKDLAAMSQEAKT